MRIGINAFFLRRPGTGIGQVTFNFLEKLKEFPISNFQFPNSQPIEFFIYTEEEFSGKDNYPKNFHFRAFLPWWKRDDVPRQWLWERMLERKARQDGCQVFLSLYQSASVFEKSFPHVMVVHDLIPFLFPEYVSKLSQKLYRYGVGRSIRRARKIVSISQATRRDLETFGIPSEKISVAYPGVNPVFRETLPAETLTAILKKYGLEPGYIYHGGGLEVRKNTENVLRAYASLAADTPALPPLVISGRIFPESNRLATPVRRLTRELGLEKQVILTDFAPEADIAALYQGAQLFVYPSLYEGFGLPVLEALCAGVPVITSRASSLPEVGGEAVLYTKPDAAAIAQALQKLLGDKTLREKLISKSREQALQFRWQSFAETILKQLLTV